MHIDIELPRPGTTLLLVAAVSGWGLLWSQSGGQAAVPPTASVTASQDAVAPEEGHAHDDAQMTSSDAPARAGSQEAAAVGGEDLSDAVRYSQAEFHAQQAREEQEMLLAKEQIMRYQLEVLRQARQDLGPTVDEKLEEQFRQSTKLLTSLILDEKRTEQFLLSSFNQMWEAQGRAVALAPLGTKPVRMSLLWPVLPLRGISAYFRDKAYKQIFKMEHLAVDIPTPKETPIRVAAGGVIKDVVDHGLGFNYITVEHPGGYSTMYGHILRFKAKKGDHVIAGDVIGFSGGLPGDPGSGLSTGPHLHFAVYMNGAAVDPLKYLPDLPTPAAAL